MKKIGFLLFGLLMAVTAGVHAAAAPQYIEAPPLSQVVKTPVGNVSVSGSVNVPVITWGGDIATVLCNGNAKTTQKGSVCDKEGLRLQLFREDDFKKQVEMYISGQTPYLRGTLAMINMALEVASKDPRTVPVVVYQHTWSAGGDAFAVKDNIKTAKDLKGKTIVLQAYGPHVDYLTKILSDAGLSIKDVKIKWVRDLTGTDNTPAAALHADKSVDAAFVIIPDALALTSGGKVGTGAEDSVRGAKILLSTKTADHIIADVYVVRSDFFKSNKKDVERFAHALLLSEEALGNLVKNKSSQAALYKATFTAGAEILMGSKQAYADTEGMYGDAHFAGYRGNVSFFGDEKYPRNFQKLTNEIQTAFVSIGLLSKKVALEHAKWDYNALKAGLANVSGVVAPKFDTAEVAKVIEKRAQQKGPIEGDLGLGFPVYFKPQQSDFSFSEYKDRFDVIIERAATYGGAMMVLDGNVDPQEYWIQKERGAPVLVLNAIKQNAKNTSLKRAEAVKKTLIKYAEKRGVKLNDTQFIIISSGIEKPSSGRICGDVGCRPKSEEEFYNNMRVEFKVMSVEAESTGFVKQ